MFVWFTLIWVHISTVCKWVGGTFCLDFGHHIFVVFIELCVCVCVVYFGWPSCELYAFLGMLGAVGIFIMKLSLIIWRNLMMMCVALY